MKSCHTKKKMYTTEALAEDALIEARTAYEYAYGRGPVTVYRCEDCGYYHLTSTGIMNEKLSKYIADGKLNLNKEANHWLSKIKNRR